MRLSRRVRRLPYRHALVVAALLAQLVAATGAPVLAPRGTKPGAVPFPCQNHTCGCSTSEQGWAGDCCCFTLEEKLAWAEARGIEPPAHVRATVEARKAAKTKKKTKSCCATHEEPNCRDAEAEAPAKVETPALRFVVGMFAQKCRGDGPAGLLKFEGTALPVHSVEVHAPRPVCDRVAVSDSHCLSPSLRPPIPPPRLS